MRTLRYGFDGPGEFVGVVVAGLVALVVGLTVWSFALVIAAVLLVYAAGGLWVSLYGKILAARRLLDTVPWRGDEQVLDVGCGHGLLLIEAAKRLTTGRAVGIDVWSQKDQWHNSREATIETARDAGVLDRVEVRDADARELPFPDASFDVVVSSLVLHNIPGRHERLRAVREIARVLKPGGRVAIVDLAHTRSYARELEAAGLSEVRRSLAIELLLPTAGTLTAR